MKSSELKFKAWNGETMQHSDDFVSLQVFFAMTDDEGYEDFRTEYLRGTGIFDCNGAEIYDGDVLAFPLRDWHKGVRRGIIETSLSGMLSGSLGINSVKDECEEMEIIGNRFENPELLK